MCLSYLALALLFLGFPDQGRARADQTVARARELPHAMNSAMALYLKAFGHLVRREDPTALEVASEALTLAREHGFPFYEACSSTITGWAVESERPAEGLRELERGIEGYLATGARVAVPRFYAHLAEV